MSSCESEGMYYHRNGGNHHITNRKGSHHWVSFHFRRYGHNARRAMRGWGRNY